MARRARYRNITIFNIALSDHAGLLPFAVPTGPAGLPNYYQARVSSEGDRIVPCFALDELPFPHRIALAKIDVEQHEVSVIRGMRSLIERDHPILIVEGHEGIYPEFLAGYGYRMQPRASGSPNIVFLPATNKNPLAHAEGGYFRRETGYSRCDNRRRPSPRCV